MLKFILALLIPVGSIAQDCSNFLELLAQRDISGELISFNKNCGPFVESISEDGMAKTWSNKEGGIELTFINRAKDQFALPKFEVLMIELTSFTNEGGYKEEFPFGFTLGMDNRMVKSHIEELQSVDFDKKNLGKTSSAFTYTGSPNSAVQNRQIRVSISQYDGKTISSMRLRLK